MAVRNQNVSKKNFGQSHFAFACPSWGNSHEQQVPHSLSKEINFKVESQPQLFYQAKHLGLQLPDRESSLTQSNGQSQNEVDAIGGSNSQDQCISSESGKDESCWKGTEGRMKPVFLFSSPEIALNHSQADNSHPVMHAPNVYADNYFGGLFTPYGSQKMIQAQLGSQMVGMTAARVPLPLDFADDGPIYVNAKQYHGILRRRQSRAKLEAQNKLLKSRKPYLHESRHLHALNRVRGSGGRFLSTKKPQQPDQTSTSSGNAALSTAHLNCKTNASKLESCRSRMSLSGGSNTTCSDVTTSISNGGVIFRQADHRFSMSAHVSGGIQMSGGLMCSGT